MMTLRPEADVRTELVELLQADHTRLGQVYRLTEEGLMAEEIARKLGVRTAGFVSNNRTVARAILDGVLPRGNGLRREAASRVRGVLASRDVSLQARAYLTSLVKILEQGQPARMPGSRGQASDRERGGGEPRKPQPATHVRLGGGPTASGRRGWKVLVEDEIARNYQVGQVFTISDFYRRSEDRLQAAYPTNTSVRATIQNILQRLRDEGILEFLRRGEYRYLRPKHRQPREAESTAAKVRLLLEELVERIAEETSIDADDYLDAATSDDPDAEVRARVYGGRTSPTFHALYRLDRLDLTLERLVLDNPKLFDQEMTAEAGGRLEYYSGT